MITIQNSGTNGLDIALAAQWTITESRKPDMLRKLECRLVGKSLLQSSQTQHLHFRPFRSSNPDRRKRAAGNEVPLPRLSLDSFRPGETSSLALDLLKQVMAAMKTGPDLTCQQKAALSQSQAKGRRRCQETASQTGSTAGMAAVPVCVPGMGGRRRQRSWHTLLWML